VLRVTNVYPMAEVLLLETPTDGRTVRLRVPSRTLCGQLEVLAVSPVNPAEFDTLLGAVRDAKDGACCSRC
jgi:hypothetical protein